MLAKMNKSAPNKELQLLDYNPEFCQAIKARFNDAKAYGKIHLDYIKTVILAGVKSWAAL